MCLLAFCGFIWTRPTAVYARKSREVKDAERAAYWGVIADVYQSHLYLSRPSPDAAKVKASIQNARDHLRAVDKTAAASFLAISDELAGVITHIEANAVENARKSLREIQSRLITEYAAHIAPVVVPDKAHGQSLYTEYCSSCHGDGRGSAGKLSRDLKSVPMPFIAPGSDESQNAFGIFATVVHGVDRSEMASMLDIIDIDQLWSIAYYVMSLRHSEKVPKPEFVEWLTARKRDFSFSALAVNSDRDLRVKLTEKGWPCDACADELAFLRNRWAFSGEAGRIGDLTLSPREKTEHRALVLLLVSVITVSALFVFVLRSRR